MDELTAYDYINLPLSELMKHADFDQEAFLFVQTVLRMKTSKLIELNRSGGY